MKNFSTYILLLGVTFGFAQIPSGYYNSATGSGYTLKTQLHTIIKNSHNPQSYAEIWPLYTQAAFRDNFFENNGSLLDMYSENPNGVDAYEYTNTSEQCGNISTEGSCYNREHLVPQSLYNDQLPMRADVHHVVPSDGKVNGWRDSYPFGVVSGTSNPCNAGATNTPCHTTNGSKKGNNLNSGYSAGYSGIVFEPIDAFKGDIARALFYFIARYEDQIVGFYNDNSSFFKDAMNGTSNQVFNNTFLNILITWHLQDPVSAKEIAINNAVYNHQSNRNPFIDTPGYVCQIWSTQCQALSNEVINTDWETKVYPNPSLDKIINIASNFDLNKIVVFNMNGQELIDKAVDSNQLSLDLKHLPLGVYLLKLQSYNQVSYKKIVLN